MFDTSIQAVMDRVDQLRESTDDHMQIPRDEALVLWQIVRIGGCRSACEIGMSYGYSTLHIAAALKEVGGHLHAIDHARKKIEAATEHLTQAGLIDLVTVHPGDARQVLAAIEPDEPFDFVFIDAVKEQSIDYLQALDGKLAARCIVAADNTGNLAERMRPYVDYVRALPNAASCDVPVGQGFELTLLEGGRTVDR
jgi:predicted O-methyltransferase YrrM